MSNYAYVAVDPQGIESRGTLDVSDQTEALRRIKEMGLFPTKVLAERPHGRPPAQTRPRPPATPRSFNLWLPAWGGGIRARTLTVFTRQLRLWWRLGCVARGLKTLQEQAESRALRRTIAQLSVTIEDGGSFTEALALHPKVFNGLYVNMVKAGEIGGALDVALRRLGDFMEKAQKIKGKVKAAMYYPCAVLCVATAILTLLMTYVVPRFKDVLEGLLGGGGLPPFTLFVLRISEAVKHNILLGAIAATGLAILFLLALRTGWGRRAFDSLKLVVPLLGPVFRKVAISRFTRTLGTLLGSGVPILQALTIVKETAGNVVVGTVILRRSPARQARRPHRPGAESLHRLSRDGCRNGGCRGADRRVARHAHENRRQTTTTKSIIRSPR